MKITRPKRTYVLVLGLKNVTASWQIRAHMQHLMNSLKKFFTTDQLVLIPAVDQPTSFYWLDGDPTNLKDKKSFEEVKKMLKPLLHTALDECLELPTAKLAVTDEAVQKLRDVMNDGMKKLDEKSADQAE